MNENEMRFSETVIEERKEEKKEKLKIKIPGKFLKKAVIVTPTDEMRAVGSNICLFAESDEEWEGQFQRVLMDEELRKVVGKRGGELVKQTYSYAKIAEQFHIMLCR